MTEPAAPALIGPAPSPDQESPRRRALGALRHALQRADGGVLARLRRADPSSPPLDFFRISVDALDNVLPQSGERRDELESRWAVVVKVMATALGTSPESGGLLGSVPFGEALAHAGIAEMRVLRLLETGSDQLADIVRSIVHALVSKGQPFSPNDLADLVLDDGTAGAEKARRRIARSFYRHHDGT